MPYTTIPPKSTRIAPAMSQLRFPRRVAFTTLRAGGSCGRDLTCVCDCIGITLLFSFESFLLLFPGVSCLPPTVDHAEDRRDEEQRGDYGEEQSTNHRAAER